MLEMAGETLANWTILAAYTARILILIVISALLLTQVHRNHFKHRPTKWIAVWIAILFGSLAFEFGLRTVARVRYLMTGAVQETDGPLWILGAIVTTVAVVGFWRVFRAARRAGRE